MELTNKKRGLLPMSRQVSSNDLVPVGQRNNIGTGWPGIQSTRVGENDTNKVFLCYTEADFSPQLVQYLYNFELPHVQHYLNKK